MDMAAWRPSIALTALAVFATCAASIAQEPKRVPGLWFFSETGDPAPKLGVIASRDDVHPNFLFADCARIRNRVQINLLLLDVDPKRYHRFLQDDEWIWLRISAGEKMADTLVVSMEINEMGPFSWKFIAQPGRAALELLALSGPIHFSLGRKVNRQFEAQQTYELPDQERAEAVGQFVNACFGVR
jgi:hypothetical protein